MIKVKNGELYRVTKKVIKTTNKPEPKQIEDFPQIFDSKLFPGVIARQVGDYVWLIDANTKRLLACELTLTCALDRFYAGKIL